MFRMISAGRNCDDVNGSRLDVCDHEKLASTIRHIQPYLVLNFAGIRAMP